MEKMETIEEFYKRKFGWLPENLKNGIGHFNVFPFNPAIGNKIKPSIYRKHDYYTISMVSGHYKMHFGNRTVEVRKNGLIFSSPGIFYVPEILGDIEDGYYAVYNQQFFHANGVVQLGVLTQYPVFQPTGNHVFDLTDNQSIIVKNIFDKMKEELDSCYIFKYDVLRTLTFELLHFALKIQPAVSAENQIINASQRITSLFLELLERQFPIVQNNTCVLLRSASDFAEKLNIHVNYLNKAVKDATQKTTTQIIAERLVHEAKLLLKYSSWNVSEISFALGFTEVTHFHNFFKKHTNLTALNFRNI